MTIVAYTHRVLAADSCWASNGTIDSLGRKIQKTKSGLVVGQAGDNDCRAIMELLRSIKSPTHLPTTKALMETRCDFLGLCVFPNGRVFKIASSNRLPETLDQEDVGVWEIAGFPYAAVGAGQELAIGAMAAGQSARQAVAIACRHNTSCRLPVHSVTIG